MPLYDYDCASCGPFTALGTISAFDAPQACPICGTGSERNLMASPSLKPPPVSVGAALRKAGVTPRHPAACGCCGPARRPAPTRLRAAAVGPS